MFIPGGLSFRGAFLPSLPTTPGCSLSALCYSELCRFQNCAPFAADLINGNIVHLDTCARSLRYPSRRVLLNPPESFKFIISFALL